MGEHYAYLRIRGLGCWAVDGLGCGSLLAPVLSRIADLAPDARSDHEGSRLRFIDRGQLGSVRARLAEIGYESEAICTDVFASLWYTPNELSREEAETLSSRMIPEFCRTHALSDGVAGQLHGVLADALFARFTDREPKRLSTEAVGDLIGPTDAAALGAVVENWLARG